MESRQIAWGAIISTFNKTFVLVEILRYNTENSDIYVREYELNYGKIGVTL